MTKQVSSSKNNGTFEDYRRAEAGLGGAVDHDFFDDDNEDVINKNDKNKRKDVRIDAGGKRSAEKSKSSRESSKTKEKSQSKKSSNHDKVQNKNESNQKAQEQKEKERREHERREKERRERERREWEVLEAERREKELEIERWERERERERARGKRADAILVSRYKPRKPPAGYKDPHDVCKQVLPTKVKEEKRQEIKALMNCIAFDPVEADSPTSGERARGKGKSAIEEMDNSLSSDTTSDITDVTPRSSSSGCSSMSKQSMNIDKPEAVKNENEGVNENSKRSKSENRSKHENEISSKQKNNIKKSGDNCVIEKGKDNQGTEADINGNLNLNEIEIEEMKYLQDAFEDLDIDEQASDFASSIISGLSEERRAKCGRKNMTFTNEQLREIERVNLILLKKIMNHRKPRTKSQSQPPVNRRTSAAINRSRMEEKIERENKILLKKLQSAKGTTGTLSQKTTPSPTYY